MKTTTQQIRRAVEIDEENRFDLSGRLLAHAAILEAEGESHDAGILSRIAQVVAAEGPEYARGWVEGAHYFAGVRIHDVWMIATEVLERRKTLAEIQEAAGEIVVRNGRFRPCTRCGQTPAMHNPLQPGSVGHDYE
jgi:hypothetical protein